MADTAHPRADRPEFPRYDWVFRSALALGGTTPTHRTTRYNGRPVAYACTTDIRTGARWCSRAWLRRTDTGVRGPLAYNQSGVSRMGMWVSGLVAGGVILVVPDDQVEATARLAADLVARQEAAPGTGVKEWSMALVREPHRTRIAVALSSIDDTIRQRLLAELDLEWIIHFNERADSEQPHTRDDFRIETPDGAHSTWRLGVIHHDNEWVPYRMVTVARAAQGRTMTGRPPARRSPALIIDNHSYRPLESDERQDPTRAPAT